MCHSKTSRINICYLVSRLRWHGPIFQLYNIIKHFDRRLFSPLIITLSPEAPDSLLSLFTENDVKIISISLSRMSGMFLGPKKIKRILDENSISLIHTFDYRSVMLCSNHFHEIPHVTTCRQAYDHIFGPILGRLMMKTFLMACKKSEAVVAVSNTIRNLVQNQNSRHIDVIYNGVDQTIFKPVRNEKKAVIREQLGLPQNKRIFLSVGFLSKMKDPITIIKGFLKSRLSNNSVLVLVGSGSLRQQCVHLAANNDNIRIIGFVQNVKDYLGAADMFVSGSLTEGCPNAVMEAMACGLPVILSDIPAHQELLNFNEEAGVVFSAGNAESLSEMLTKIDSLHYSVRSQAALNIINKHGNARKMSLKYQQLYKQLFE
ncbi:D-inositol-3-phosphate glycosyltransferase [subsurface metagenome]